MNFKVHLPMHSVSLLLLVLENTKLPSMLYFIKGISKRGHNKNPQVLLKWKPSEEKDFLCYKVWRKGENESEYKMLSTPISLNTALYADIDVHEGCKYSYKVQAVNASFVKSHLSDNIEVLVE